MSDGKGIPGQIGEAIKGGAKAATIDLAKDIFEQIMNGGTGDAGDDDEQGSSGAPLQHQRMMYQAQKNARMAQIQRNIQRLKQEREKARKQVQHQEQARQQQLEQQKEAAQQAQQEHGFAHKTAGLMKNIGNFIARKGKGEQRGNKIAG